MASLVLAAGAAAALGLGRGTRGVLEASRESLRLQLLATRVLEETRTLVRQGDLADLEAEEEAVRETTEGELRVAAIVRRSGPGDGFEVRIEAEDGTRTFGFSTRVADPFAWDSGAVRAAYAGMLEDPFASGRHR